MRILQMFFCVAIIVKKLQRSLKNFFMQIIVGVSTRSFGGQTDFFWSSRPIKGLHFILIVSNRVFGLRTSLHGKFLLMPLSAIVNFFKYFFYYLFYLLPIYPPENRLRYYASSDHLELLKKIRKNCCLIEIEMPKYCCTTEMFFLTFC